MRETITYVTQSKFFSPAFNAAIFDGPIRIYFAQYQEAQALKVYFNLQERFGEIRKNARGIFKDKGRSIFVMLYPNKETFDSSFTQGEGGDEALEASGTEPGSASGAAAGSTSTEERFPLGAWAGGNIAKDRLGRDFVLGVRGPLEDEDLTELYQEMDTIVRSIEA